ncbi:MAG: HAD-IIB family hydrolase [Planctomycetota bacterium]|nr:HAD-IIB family hydrolase [Planctomycetota bacterium]
MSWIVFTDLDGSLLDEADYSFEAARPALAALRERGIPLVLITSKTHAEVALLAGEIGTSVPYVVENGGAIYIPPGNPEIEGGGALADGTRRIALGRPQSELRAFLVAARERWPLRGFGDMDAAEVAALCDFSVEAAVLAKEREFSEPFRIDDPAGLEGLAAAARAEGLDVTRGGRFHHLIAAGQSKAVALRVLVEAYARSRDALRSIAVGDSPNDRAMLEAADVAVVIPRPDGTHLELGSGAHDVIVAPHPGAAGWNAALIRLLESA